jgi:hypothetical protein
MVVNYKVQGCNSRGSKLETLTNGTSSANKEGPNIKGKSN